MELSDWITLTIALLGAGLGVWNTVQAARDRAVRFRVRATQAIFLQAPVPTCLSIGVTNYSAFTITIEEVGLTVGKPRGSLPRRAMFTPYNIVDGQLPMRLEPHHSGSVAASVGELPNDGYNHAYARTSGGEVAFGTSPALLQWVQSVTR